MKQRKIPLRKCTGCQEMKNKKISPLYFVLGILLIGVIAFLNPGESHIIYNCLWVFKKYLFTWLHQILAAACGI